VSSDLKAESAIIITITICVSAALYFAYLSLQQQSDTLQKQFTTFAVYSIVAGAVLLTCLIVYAGVKKAMSGVSAQLDRPQNQQ